MQRPVVRKERSIQASSQLHVVYGRFALHHDGGAVPYFSTVMTLNEANDSLRIAPELTADSFSNWTIEELFQRQIDWARVSREVVPYLKAPDRQQFFSAITVALLPIIDGSRVNDMSDTRFAPPELEHPEQFDPQGRIKLGPFSLGYYNPWTDPTSPGAVLAQLRWNEEQVFAVAIDGQHRLAAIRQVVRNAPPGAEFLNTTRIPVLLIPITAELGYKPAHAGETPVHLLRKLFIDLNKHAQKPTRAREILLDDADLQSRCVRELIGSELSSGFIEMQTGVPEKLPLSLVDWHSEQAKFDEGPYLTTVLGLDWVVGKLLGLGSVRDWTAASDIENQMLTPIEQGLGFSLPDSIRSRLQNTLEKGRPFSFLPSDLNLVCARFRDVLAPAIAHVFAALSPYRQLIDARRANQLDSAEFAQWFSLYEAGADSQAGEQAMADLSKFEEDLRNRPEPGFCVDTWRNQALDELKELKDDAGLPFLVVFQKAIFLAFNTFRRMDPEDVEMSDEELIDDDLTVADGVQEDEGADRVVAAANADDNLRDRTLAGARKYVDSINAMLVAQEGREFLSGSCTVRDADDERERKFWLGSVLDEDNTIDFSQVASKRAADWLLLATYFYYIVRDDPEGYAARDFDDYYTTLRAQETADLGEIEKRCKNLLDRLQRPQSSAAKVARRRLELERLPDDRLQDLVWDEFRARAAFLWTLAFQAASSPQS